MESVQIITKDNGFVLRWRLGHTAVLTKAEGDNRRSSGDEVYPDYDSLEARLRNLLAGLPNGQSDGAEYTE